MICGEMNSFDISQIRFNLVEDVVLRVEGGKPNIVR